MPSSRRAAARDCRHDPRHRFEERERFILGAVSQRAPQAYSDPWLGYTELISDVDSDQTLIDVSTDEAICDALEGRESEFVKAIVEFGQQYGDVARDDHQLFIDAFRNHRIMDL